MTDRRVLVFGDSGTWGAFDEEFHGWVNRLQLSLDKSDKDYFEIYNLGISGDTTEQLLKRIKIECEARLKGEEAEGYDENIIIVAMGENDSSLVNNKKELVPLGKFKKNLEKILHVCKKYADYVLFVGCGVVDEKRTNPVPFNEELFFNNERMGMYSNEIRGMCEEKRLLFIDVAAPLSRVKEEVLDDGLHLNNLGHKIVAETVEKELLRYLEKKDV